MDAKLIEGYNKENAAIFVMSHKKDIFGNWKNKWIFGDYIFISKIIKLNKYTIFKSNLMFYNI